METAIKPPRLRVGRKDVTPDEFSAALHAHLGKPSRVRHAHAASHQSCARRTLLVWRVVPIRLRCLNLCKIECQSQSAVIQNERHHWCI